ncbi:MAG: alpha/beta hydrolase [Pikeienuella sp.]
MADYSKLIDAETWAFIKATADHYPDETVTFSIEDQRRVYDQMCVAMNAGRPAGVAVEDRAFDGVPCRVYERRASVVTVVYFHGGGFVVGGLDSHDDVCAEICARTGYRVVSVDYRMSPEHRHPAAFDDSFAVTKAVAAAFTGGIVLAGDSAGGNLAAGVAHASRGVLENVVGQVLIYPGLGGDFDKGSYLTHANAPMLTRDDILFYRSVRFHGDEPVGDPTYAPLHDSSFANLPPTVVISAECDPLSDDGLDYRNAVQKAGGKAVWFNEDGLIHGYLRGRTTVRRAAASFDRIIAAIAALGQGEWPY